MVIMISDTKSIRNKQLVQNKKVNVFRLLFFHNRLKSFIRFSYFNEKKETAMLIFLRLCDLTKSNPI